ncbi:metal-sensing transcriptional repressor [Collinsella stercoris]|uniref:metal-sensing transcriptional repressor n=1 Tax=Collinsella stercoris TaxID=147206 RepID=UPI002EB59B6E|nr:metal-sensing transcriptional repressor [Collinsella stercoris]
MMADRERTLRLLKTARGQIDGIIKMVEDDRYCIDISTQLMATQSLIGRVNADVLKAHIGGCVQQAVESGTDAEKTEKLAEIGAVIEKLAK